MVGGRPRKTGPSGPDGTEEGTGAREGLEARGLIDGIGYVEVVDSGMGEGGIGVVRGGGGSGRLAGMWRGCSCVWFLWSVGRVAGQR